MSAEMKLQHTDGGAKSHQQTEHHPTGTWTDVMTTAEWTVPHHTHPYREDCLRQRAHIHVAPHNLNCLQRITSTHCVVLYFASTMPPAKECA